MTAILGISALYHDSAAALVVDGDVVAAAQEERFTREKHDFRFPSNAIDFCLERGKVSMADLDYAVFYDKPFMKFDRLLETYLAFAPRGYVSFSKAIPLWLREKLNMRREIRGRLGEKFAGRIVFPEHHESHAAAAFFPSPFEEAAILTIDGVGEWATASVGVGRGNEIKLLETLEFPHSLGLLYSAFTHYAGFKVNSGEYKLMGLAPYGKPTHVDVIKDHLIDVKADGSLWMDMRYFNYCQGLTMTSKAFHDLFGGPPRRPESRVTQKEMDLAASVQAVTEEVMLKMAARAREATGSPRLCLAGGVALNCVANGKIIASGEFEDVWIQPASGDAGGAVGGALLAWHQLLRNPRRPAAGDSQKGSLLGCAYDNDQVRRFLEKTGVEAEADFLPDEALVEIVADHVADQKVIGWFRGPMEFGPRALGSRSIIGDARSETMQSTMNLKIKYRESFRPFAPCVLAEDVSDYFELDRESPYMLIVAPVAEKRRRALTEDQRRTMTSDPDLRRRVNVPRSEIPAVTHIDYSARVQTVDRRRHGLYYDMLRKFKEKTGCPVIINTSFNIRGEPIVRSPEDAFRCFMNTEMDVLVLNNYILLKERQKGKSDRDAKRYKESFQLD